MKKPNHLQVLLVCIDLSLNSLVFHDISGVLFNFLLLFFQRLLTGLELALVMLVSSGKDRDGQERDQYRHRPEDRPFQIDLLGQFFSFK